MPAFSLLGPMADRPYAIGERPGGSDIPTIPLLSGKEAWASIAGRYDNRHMDSLLRPDADQTVAPRPTDNPLEKRARGGGVIARFLGRLMQRGGSRAAGQVTARSLAPAIGRRTAATAAANAARRGTLGRVLGRWGWKPLAGAAALGGGYAGGRLLGGPGGLDRTIARYVQNRFEKAVPTTAPAPSAQGGAAPAGPSAAPPRAPSPPPTAQAGPDFLSEYGPMLGGGALGFGGIYGLGRLLQSRRRRKEDEEDLAIAGLPKVAAADPTRFCEEFPRLAGFLCYCDEHDLDEPTIHAQLKRASSSDAELGAEMEKLANVFGDMLGNAWRFGKGLGGSLAGGVGTAGATALGGLGEGVNWAGRTTGLGEPMPTKGIWNFQQDAANLATGGLRDIGRAVDVPGYVWGEPTRGSAVHDVYEEVRNRPGVKPWARNVSQGAETVGTAAATAIPLVGGASYLGGGGLSGPALGKATTVGGELAALGGMGGRAATSAVRFPGRAATSVARFPVKHPFLTWFGYDIGQGMAGNPEKTTFNMVPRIYEQLRGDPRPELWQNQIGQTEGWNRAAKGLYDELVQARLADVEMAGGPKHYLHQTPGSGAVPVFSAAEQQRRAGLMARAAAALEASNVLKQQGIDPTQPITQEMGQQLGIPPEMWGMPAKGPAPGQNPNLPSAAGAAAQRAGQTMAATGVGPLGIAAGTGAAVLGGLDPNKVSQLPPEQQQAAMQAGQQAASALADPDAAGQAVEQLGSSDPNTPADQQAFGNLTKQVGDPETAMGLYQGMDVGAKTLLWGGLALGAIGLLSALSDGEGGLLPWIMTILGGGAALGALGHGGLLGKGVQGGIQGLLGQAKQGPPAEDVQAAIGQFPSEQPQPTPEPTSAPAGAAAQSPRGYGASLAQLREGGITGAEGQAMLQHPGMRRYVMGLPDEEAMSIMGEAAESPEIAQLLRQAATDERAFGVMTAPEGSATYMGFGPKGMGWSPAHARRFIELARRQQRG